jgi:hypothetical protein
MEGKQEAYLWDPTNGYMTPVLYYGDYIIHNNTKFGIEHVETPKALEETKKYWFLNRTIKYIVRCHGNIYYIFS